MIRLLFLLALLVSGVLLPEKTAFSVPESSLEARLYQDEEHHLTSPFACSVGLQESETGKDKDETTSCPCGDYHELQGIGLYSHNSVVPGGAAVQNTRLHLLNMVFRN